VSGVRGPKKAKIKIVSKDDPYFIPPPATPVREPIPQTKVPKIRHAKLKALKCFKDVHDMICSGWTTAEVASYIQEQRREMLDQTPASIEWQLSQYRTALPPGALTPIQRTPTYKKAVAKIKRGIDELAELEKLYELQMQRITIDFETEKKINKLMPTMTREIKCARDILVSMAELKMDLGLDERHLGKLDVGLEAPEELAARFGKPLVGQVLQNAESRQKLLALVDKFAKVQQAKTIIEVEGTESDRD